MKCNLSFEDMLTYFEAAICRMFKRAFRDLVFNVMCKQVT